LTVGEIINYDQSCSAVHLGPKANDKRPKTLVPFNQRILDYLHIHFTKHIKSPYVPAPVHRHSRFLTTWDELVVCRFGTPCSGDQFTRRRLTMNDQEGPKAQYHPFRGCSPRYATLFFTVCHSCCCPTSPGSVISI
jgi:hypothetical protein